MLSMLLKVILHREGKTPCLVLQCIMFVAVLLLPKFNGSIEGKCLDIVGGQIQYGLLLQIVGGEM